MNTVVLVILILILLGAFGTLPSWPYATNWGYGPSGLLGIVVVVMVILLLLGKL